MPLPLSPPSASVHSRFPLPLDRETDSPSCFGIHCATQSREMSLHKCQNQYVTHTRMKDPTKQIAWEQTRIMMEKYIHCELSVKQVLILDGIIMSLWSTAWIGILPWIPVPLSREKDMARRLMIIIKQFWAFHDVFHHTHYTEKIMIPKRNKSPTKPPFSCRKGDLAQENTT